MKAKIDKNLCKYCEFGDKGNTLNGVPICIAKMEEGNCRFDK